MGKPYHTIHRNDTQALVHFLRKNRQALLPLVQLIEQSKLAVDELIDVLGRASIEAVLQLSAEAIAGPPHPGKKGGAVGWHGSESGTVALSERKLQRQMHALMAAVLLRMARLDALDAHAQPEPPDRELVQAEQGVRRSKGNAVIAADVGRQAALPKKPLKQGKSGFARDAACRWASMARHCPFSWRRSDSCWAAHSVWNSCRRGSSAFFSDCGDGLLSCLEASGRFFQRASGDCWLM